MLRIAIVDPQPAVRAGLVALLRSEPGLVPVAAAGTQEEAVALIGRRRVDLVILDPELLGPDGLPFCRRVKALEPGVQVVAYTAAAEPAYAMGARVAGADAVVDKGAPPQALFEAIRRAGRSTGAVPALTGLRVPQPRAAA